MIYFDFLKISGSWSTDFLVFSWSKALDLIKLCLYNFSSGANRSISVHTIKNDGAPKEARSKKIRKPPAVKEEKER